MLAYGAEKGFVGEFPMLSDDVGASYSQSDSLTDYKEIDFKRVGAWANGLFYIAGLLVQAREIVKAVVGAFVFLISMLQFRE